MKNEKYFLSFQNPVLGYSALLYRYVHTELINNSKYSYYFIYFNKLRNNLACTLYMYACLFTLRFCVFLFQQRLFIGKWFYPVNYTYISHRKEFWLSFIHP